MRTTFCSPTDVIVVQETDSLLAEIMIGMRLKEIEGKTFFYTQNGQRRGLPSRNISPYFFYQTAPGRKKEKSKRDDRIDFFQNSIERKSVS